MVSTEIYRLRRARCGPYLPQQSHTWKTTHGRQAATSTVLARRAQPHISAATLELHHGQHEAGYVERVNRLVADTPLAQASLDEIVAAARKLENRPPSRDLVVLRRT